MATRSRQLNFDVTTLLDHAASQFRGLNAREPGQWPALPKLAAWLGAALVVVVAGWFAVVSSAADELQGRARPRTGAEIRLPQASWRKRSTLTELRKQKLQVQEYVTQLEKQLPGKAEMDALLSDINQAGLGRGLQFELFRPGQVEVKEYYAELPITIRVTGRYHDHRLVRGRRGQPVAHRDAAQPEHRGSAGEGRCWTTCRWTPRHGPIATSDTSEVDAQRRAAAKAAGAKK